MSNEDKYNKVTTVPNANFTSIGGASVHDKTNPAYIEYRRRWTDNPPNFVVDKFPVHLDIEATNRCNLKCTFCDKLPLIPKDKFGFLDFNLFKNIIDEGKENGLCSIKLSYRGEPLLHPKIMDMVAYAKDSGLLDVYFNTNAMLLTEKKAAELIDAGLDRISISVEGIVPAQYEKERVGASFSTVINNIDTLISTKEKMNVSHPRIRVQTVALPGIDLEEYVKFWSSHSDETAALDYNEYVVQRNTSLVDTKWACPQLWQRMTIEWSGEIMPCNNDDFGKLSPGNVNTMSVHDCWHSEIVERARALHKEGKSHMVEACNGCPWRTTQILKHQSES